MQKGQKQRYMSLSMRTTELAELNPQFKGIGKELVKSHNVKKQVRQHRMDKIGRVAYLQKEEDLAEKLVIKKQRELQTLMAVIARKQADTIQKQERRRAKEEAMAVQRQLNMRRKSEHQQKIRNAFLGLYDQHQQNANKMHETIRKHDQLRRSFHMETLHAKHEKVHRRSQDRQEGREKIRNYLKEKADMFTNRYKQKIQEEQAETRQLSQEAKQIEEIEGELKLRLENSNSRIQALNNEINRTANESRVLNNNASWNWSALSKNHLSLDTKEESSSNNPDNKVDKMIEKELSLEDEDIS